MKFVVVATLAALGSSIVCSMIWSSGADSFGVAISAFAMMFPASMVITAVTAWFLNRVRLSVLGRYALSFVIGCAIPAVVIQAIFGYHDWMRKRASMSAMARGAAEAELFYRDGFPKLPYLRSGFGFSTVGSAPSSIDLRSKFGVEETSKELETITGHEWQTIECGADRFLVRPASHRAPDSVDSIWVIPSRFSDETTVRYSRESHQRLVLHMAESMAEDIESTHSKIESKSRFPATAQAEYQARRFWIKVNPRSSTYDAEFKFRSDERVQIDIGQNVLDLQREGLTWRLIAYHHRPVDDGTRSSGGCVLTGVSEPSWIDTPRAANHRNSANKDADFGLPSAYRLAIHLTSTDVGEATYFIDDPANPSGRTILQKVKLPADMSFPIWARVGRRIGIVATARCTVDYRSIE